MDCLFCKIVSGEIPSKKIYENSDVIVFLDINPASRGHSLVVPKKHAATISDIKDDDLEKAIRTVKHIAQRMKEKLNAEGVNILQNNGRIATQLVDHVHFHVVPRYANDGIQLHLPRAQVSEEDMKSLQAKLKEDAPPATYSAGPGW